jgi:hypothetical protein
MEIEMAKQVSPKVTTKIKAKTPKAPKPLRTIKSAISWGAMASSLAKAATPLPEFVHQPPARTSAAGLVSPDR